MDTLMALAVSIGVLIALWVKFGGLLVPGLAIAVPAGIVAFLIVIQSKIALLSFIPGGFCGAALTAASGVSDVKGYLLVALSLVAGAVLGYVSELGAGVLAKKPSA